MAANPARRGLHTRAFDLASAAPLVVLYASAIAGEVLNIRGQWSSARHALDYERIAADFVSLAFFGLQLALFLFRRLPIGKSQGPWPRIAALLGANANVALLLLPKVSVAGTMETLSLAISAAGTIGAFAVLAWLGRSFSIFPEARGLVTGGPYRVVRHPLYFFEIVATLGIMLRFRQPWAALIALATLAFQFRRMAYEEAVLRAIYPEYDDYTRRTPARVMPGVY